ncbi:MAG: VOC family protein, partial [Terriglobales bacterium]
MFKRTSLICCRLSFVTLVLLLSFRLAVTQSAMAQENKSVTLELDHVSICGSNLDTLRQAFSEVGLAPDIGGPHGNGITQMAIIGFDDTTYIELIAPIQPGVTAGSDWS